MTYDDVLTISAALNNDASKSEYTNAAQFPYLNVALSELQEIFELNGIPSTQTSSPIMNVPAGTTAITFTPEPPIVGVDYLPDNLIEINELFSSPEGQNNWARITKKDYLTSDFSSAELSFINVWAWQEQEIRFLACNQNNDIKADIIVSLFPIIDEDNVDDNLTILNSATFLNYRTGALCAEYLAENPSRAASLNSNASLAIDRTLGINTKGKQSIIYRRRPFRAAFKRKGLMI